VERQTVKTSSMGSDKPLEDGAAVIRHHWYILCSSFGHSSGIKFIGHLLHYRFWLCKFSGKNTFNWMFLMRNEFLIKFHMIRKNKVDHRQATHYTHHFGIMLCEL
jgi:hypothetical protein